MRVAAATNVLVRYLVAGEPIRSSTDVDQPVFAAGLDMLRSGGDFADGCLLALTRQANCKALLTFDKDFARKGGELVRLVSST